MTPRVRGASSYRSALHAYIAANLSFIDAHRTAIRALTEILLNARAVPGLAESFRAAQRRAVDELAALFEGGRLAGEFGDVPPRILATSLRATIDSLSEALRADPGLDLDEFRDGLESLFDHATATTTARAARRG